MAIPTKKQLEYLRSIERECRIMKRDCAIGLPGDVSEYMVKKCIRDGLVVKECKVEGILPDGRTMSTEVYRLTRDGEKSLAATSVV